MYPGSLFESYVHTDPRYRKVNSCTVVLRRHVGNYSATWEKKEIKDLGDRASNQTKIPYLLYPNRAANVTGKQV